LDKRPLTIGNMFDRIAPTYDGLNAALSFSLDRSWRKAAIRALAIDDGDSVIDIAAGTGDLALLALAAAHCSVVGIDLSAKMLVQSVIKGKKYGDDARYCAVQGDALAIPVKDGSFHKAMVAFGLRNMHSVEQFLDEVYRILNAHGRLAVLEFSIPQNVVFKRIYLVYFRWILPFVGGLVSGDFKAYQYLHDSVMSFLSSTQLEQVMEKKKFNIIRSTPLVNGIAHLFILDKMV
jgi:demethylmenaquinone methyltransferase/2-methoxy-6-polyprenyl-1,4-benzoquinol methylase